MSLHILIIVCYTSYVWCIGADTPITSLGNPGKMPATTYNGSQCTQRCINDIGKTQAFGSWMVGEVANT